MRFRSWINIALLIAVAVVATAIFLLRDGGRLDPAPLTELDPGAVTSFSVRYADDRPDMRLEGGAAGWRLVEPIEHPARSARVVRILSFLDDRSDACYADSDERRVDFGLDEPRLTLGVNGAEVDFGDRSQGGRRYVRSGERLCLIDDVAFPLLDQGLEGVAVMSLLPGDGSPVAIRTPEAEAIDPNGEDDWTFERGEGAGQRWSVRWRSANITDFDLDPPSEDLGEVEIELAEGPSRRWRIAQQANPEEGQHLVLVPQDSDYGVRVAPDEAGGLIEPPDAVEDGLN